MRAEPGDPPDLLLGRIGEMDDDRAVIGARVLGHQLFENVQHDIEAEIAVDVDVELIAGVPEEPRALLELVGRHDPFALVAVEIAVLHLHELRDDRPVGEELDLLREEHELLAGPGGRDGDLLLDRLERLCRGRPGPGMPRPSARKVAYIGVPGAPRISS